MDLKITFSQHHFKESSSGLNNQMPWDRVKSIEVVGTDFEHSTQRQMKRYLSDCAREIKNEIRRTYSLKKKEESQKNFRLLREVKKGIERTLHRLRIIKAQTGSFKKPWQEVQERQERLMLERWPLILEREEDYRNYHQIVRPYVQRILAGSLDPVISSKGEVVERKRLKIGQKATQSQGISKLAAKLRSLEAQLDIYTPRHLPKTSSENWKQELKAYLEESLEAMRCGCEGCCSPMSSVCSKTGELYCEQHQPPKNVYSLDWALGLATALKRMHSL